MTNSTQNESAIIPFHGAALRVKEVDGVKWIAVRPICEHLGIHAQAQMEKLAADDRFSCTVIRMTAEDGKNYEMTCLNLDELLGWLYTINPNKVKAQARPVLLAYQKETTKAINDYWTTGQATRPSGISSADDQTLGLFELALNTMKEQRAQIGQLSLEQQAIQHRLDTFPINGLQGRKIHAAVTELARLLGGKPHHFQKAWRELYNRFSIVAYRDLPSNRFEEAMQFLTKLIEAYRAGDNLGMGTD